MYILKNLLSTWGMVQTNQVYSNNDQGSVYSNYKFQDPRGLGSYGVLGRGQISQYTEYASSILSMYSASIAIVLRNYTCTDAFLSYC